MAQESSYLQYLPAVYRKDGYGVESDFMGRFLLAFERVLSGVEGDTESPRGLEEVLDSIADYFDPNRAPAPLLPFLASWVDLELQDSDDWNRDLDDPDANPLSGDVGRLESDEEQIFPLDLPLNTRNRNLIKEAAWLYRQRGTRTGIENYISIYTGESNVFVREFHEPIQIGVTSTVGQNTIVGDLPYYFQVEIFVLNRTPVVLAEYVKAIREIVDQQKPAHTYYDLVIYLPTMQVAEYSTVGEDTLLGGKVIIKDLYSFF